MSCILRRLLRQLSGEWLRGGQGYRQTASMRLRHFPDDDDDDDDVVIHDLAGCEADGFEGHVETFASLLPCLEWALLSMD